MKDFGTKKRFRLADVKKNASCCAGSAEDKDTKEPCCIDAEKQDVKDHGNASCCANEAAQFANDRKSSPCCAPDDMGEAEDKLLEAPLVNKIDGDWSVSDKIGAIRCRISGFRNKYIVNPGLYSIGVPDAASNVFVSANYKLSFDVLRRALKGMNAWILVLDTKGINVWCAAGKGTFGTAELVKRIKEANLKRIVEHRRVIAPQLGGPGIAAHEVQKATGFRVLYGPIKAGDIPDFISNGYKADGKLRKAEFPFLDRLVLTPMELIPAFKHYLKFALIILLVFGVEPDGIRFSDTVVQAWPYLVLGLVAILAGAVVTPALLPYIPFRSFAVKGWVAGVGLVALAANTLGNTLNDSAALLVFTYLFYPMAASYVALQFTGSTVYTGMSGVKKELKYAVPVYMSSLAVSVLLLIVYKTAHWGLL